MSSLQVRPFRRADRDQLTDLVNAHIAAAVPGVSVSVHTVLSQLERQPDEVVVDPWVSERVTLVTEQRTNVIAAAHLPRYSDTDEVGPSLRGAGEIDWFLCRPEGTVWKDTAQAADLLLAACLAQFARWGVSARLADASLPAPGCCGVQDSWPHIRAAYERAGFVHTGHTEIVLIAEVEELPRPATAPVAGLAARRTVGECGTRFTAYLAKEAIGLIEVDTNLAPPERLARLGGWADIGNFHVVDAYQDTGVAEWLLGQAADWLRLAGIDKLLAYAWPNEAEELERLGRAGFSELSRAARDWTHRADPRPAPCDG